MRYDLIESMRQSYPIVLMCQVLDVSESGFHARSSRPLCTRKRENARLEIEILADHGMQTTPSRVRALRKKLSLRCKQKLKFKVTTDSRHHLPIAPDILNREFTVKASGAVWVSDITDTPTDEGWWYLAGVKDRLNGELVGMP